VTSGTEKGDIAVSPEVLEVFEVLKEVKSSSGSVSTLVEGTEHAAGSQCEATTTAEPPNTSLWRALEDEIGAGIDGNARKRITAELERQGMDLEQLLSYRKRFPQSKKARSPVGVLIATATTLTLQITEVGPNERDRIPEDREYGVSANEKESKKGPCSKCVNGWISVPKGAIRCDCMKTHR
jgi:hypothetical protein